MIRIKSVLSGRGDVKRAFKISRKMCRSLVFGGKLQYSLLEAVISAVYMTKMVIVQLV